MKGQFTASAVARLAFPFRTFAAEAGKVDLDDIGIEGDEAVDPQADVEAKLGYVANGRALDPATFSINTWIMAGAGKNAGLTWQALLDN